MAGFRTDINGLRALAVAAVVFYHLGTKGFNGGYVGVDVFYVISGFLMTQIVLARGDILAFYAARARRILPALAALVLALLGLGFFLMPPNDYATLGQHALSALGFYSNILFSNGGDYFDTAAREKWLLHTWSLSVEWQFYLLLPLALAVLKKLDAVRTGLFAATAASFAASILWTAKDPGVAFFVLPTRAWEMLAGGLICLYAGKLPRTPALSYAGIAAILAATFLYSDALAYPGAFALLPVLGAAAIIIASAQNPLLDNAAAQFLGKISYSLYLWHWPVIVATRWLGMEPGLLLLLPIFLLSYASWALIEEPFRRHRDKTPLKLAAYAALAALAGALVIGKGFPARVPADVVAATTMPESRFPPHGSCAANYKDTTALPDCRLGAKAPPTAALWGDSHASALASALGEALAQKARAALVYSYAGCPPVLDALQPTKRKAAACRDINRLTFDHLAADKKIRDVFIVARWPLYQAGYNEKGELAPRVAFEKASYTDKITDTLCGLAAAGKNVYAVALVPEIGRSVPDTLARARMRGKKEQAVDLPRSAYEERAAPYKAALARAAKTCGVHVLDPATRLCDANFCHGLKDGLPLYTDDNHLNARGNTVLMPQFAAALSRRR